MCGRFANRAKPEQIKKEFKISTNESFVSEPRYNIAPAQMIDVVFNRAESRILAPLKWGLVPSWAKEAPAAARMINARSETITEKPSFREAFKKRRSSFRRAVSTSGRRLPAEKAESSRFIFTLKIKTFSDLPDYMKNGSINKRANCSKAARLSRPPRMIF